MCLGACPILDCSTAGVPDLAGFSDPFRSIVPTIRLKRSKILTQTSPTS